jgi:putative DNA primase/helicase
MKETRTIILIPKNPTTNKHEPENKKSVEVIKQSDNKFGWRCLCPFHNDTKPSCWINLTDEPYSFVCKSCGITGIVHNDSFKKRKPEFKPTQEFFPYINKKGKEVFQIVKYLKPTGKEFAIRHKKNGEWIYKVPDNDLNTLILYHEDEIYKRKDDIVFLCSGESDAETLREWEFLATTNPLGEGNWRPQYNKTLANRRVFFIQDNDYKGDIHRDSIIENLLEITTWLKTIIMPDVPEKEDVKYWVKAMGGTKEQFLEIVDNEMPLVKKTDTWYINDKNKQIFIKNNVARFLTQDKNLIFHEEDFYRWSKKKKLWEMIDSDEVSLMIHKNVGTSITTPMTMDIKTQMRVYCRQSEMNANKNYINLINMVYDTEKNKTIQHQKRHFSSIRVGLNWQESAKCPKSLDLINKTLNSQDKVDFLQQIFGYMLCPGINLKKAFFFLGEANSGKSTMLEILELLVGEDNTSHLSLDGLKKEAFMVLGIKDKLVNMRHELPTNFKLIDGLFKELIDKNPTFNINQKYNPKPLKVKPFAKHIYAGNNFIYTADNSQAIYKRIEIIEFTEVHEKINDELLDEIIKPELAGLFQWAIAGLLKVLENRAFEISPEIIKTKDRYFKNTNTIEAFLEERTLRGPSLKIKKLELFEKYKLFCFNKSIPAEIRTVFMPYVESTKGVDSIHSHDGDYFLYIDILNQEEEQTIN